MGDSPAPSFVDLYQYYAELQTEYGEAVEIGYYQTGDWLIDLHDYPGPPELQPIGQQLQIA